MDNPNSEHKDNWDVYQTGDTNPPKKHGGLMAGLLVVVIFLGGIASALGISNMQLHRELKQQKEDTPLSFYETDCSLPSDSQISEDTAAPVTTQETVDLNIAQPPESADNVPAGGGMALQDIYEKNIPSVVSISSTSPAGTFTGTGVVLSKDGYLVTNSHVIEDGKHIEVLFSNQTLLSAQIVGSDPISDLAVLRVDATNLIPAEFGDSSSLRVGDVVAAIGDPLGIELRGTMTDGIISAINRDITTGGRTMTLLQTNAALNSGNSGGPLINAHGQVIGINTMKIGDHVSKAGVEGLGFAIPSTTVKDVVNQLISQGFVSGRPTLGLVGEGISILYQNLYALPEGLYITQVAPDSDAAAKGISPGDILISMDGSRVPNLDIYHQILYSHQAGDQVTIIVYRAGNSYRINLTVDQAQ